ncbi:hypothetical protein MJN76_33645, partial [Salmonella enterica subsp. enterica serovar Anatum]|nr:hypothetical protein [Salmonella enterica subsp. enterica serovar Anatum]
KREINPDLAEQAVTQDEEYRLRSIPEGRQDEHYPNDERVKQHSTAHRRPALQEAGSAGL